MRELHRLVWPLLLCVLGWGAYYIFRTSFLLDDERIFTLWDDGMISMRYARHLAEGKGLVWNVGEDPVQGFSNPGVTLTMSLIHLFPFSSAKVSLPFQIGNLLIFGALVLGAARLSTRLFPKANAWSGLAAAAAVALCAPVAVWSLQGSDVGFTTIWLFACMGLFCGSDSARDRWLPWVAGLGPLIRPDLALFAGVILCGTLLQPGARWKRFATGCSVLLAACLSLLALGLLYYGDPLPNTVYLKVTGSPRGEVLAVGFRHLGERLPQLFAALALAAIAVFRAGRSAAGVQTAAALVIASLAYNTWIGGDWLRQYESRFIAPSLPLLLILAVEGLRISLDRMALQPRLQHALLLALACLVAWISNPPGATSDWLDPGSSTMYREHNERHVRYGRYLREHTDSTTTLAVHWGGVAPYFSERFSIDVLGKSDRHIAKQPARRFKPGHSKRDWPYVLGERKPDIFLHAPAPLRKRADFRRDYVLARSADIALFVRKQSLSKLHSEWLILEDLETGERSERRAIR